MFINSPYDGYWNNASDSNVLRTVLANSMQWERKPMAVAIAPTNSGNYVNGTWNGNITVLQAATNVMLTAKDGAGHVGSSGLFSIIYSNQPPIIFSQPTNQSLPAGYTATFTLTADGSPPLSYFWARNGTFIPGATN